VWSPEDVSIYQVCVKYITKTNAHTFETTEVHHRSLGNEPKALRLVPAAAVRAGIDAKDSLLTFLGNKHAGNLEF